jgi:hypothetical protein
MADFRLWLWRVKKSSLEDMTIEIGRPQKKTDGNLKVKEKDPDGNVGAGQKTDGNLKVAAT